MEENFAKYSSVDSKNKDILHICRNAAAGDETARRKLMDLLFDRIHQSAVYLADSSEEAEDVAQIACMEVLASVGTFRGDSSLQYWADRVTMYTAAKILQKKKRRQGIVDAFFQPSTPVPETDELAGQAAIRHRVSLLLRKIKYKHREILLLRYVHGYTTAEAAALSNVPLETARGRLKKGRATLKKKMLADPLISEWMQEWVQQ